MQQRTIVQQLLAAVIIALIAVFSVMVWVVQQRAETAALSVAETNLAHEARLMVGTLDALFEAIQQRGEAQSRFFLRFAGGKPELVPGTQKTGEVDLPIMRIGGEIQNGNDRLLKSFRDLTGEETAFLILKDGQLYRLSTTLKDKDGKPMNGTVLPASDPVAKAILAGQDYQGLAIRGGKYNFSTVKALKDADGKVWGAYSIRINLEHDLKRIREQFSQVVAGKTGYVYIVRPTDEQTVGEFVLHPKFQEKNLVEAALSDSVKAMVKEQLAKKEGIFHYLLPDAEGRERAKLVYAATSSKWGWTLASGSWQDEYLEESHALRNAMLLISLLAALALASLLYFLISTRLKGLKNLVGEVEKLSAGDLRVQVADADPGSDNEVHVIGNAFNRMAENMRRLVGGVATTAGLVGQAAGELQQAAQAALESSEKASQSASGIASSVEELSVSVTHVAENADHAADISGAAKRVTDSGRRVVGGTMQELQRVAGDIADSAAMIESLGERSKQISNVVGVIREIAEQTNLLALNAAIEAARAGEQGRGFAVVADEVRKLAERTSLSTQEIANTVTAILAETQGAVERMQSVSANMDGSVSMAREADSALATIDQHALETVSVVQGIAASTREQSAASHEIARLVEQIAEMAESSSHQAETNTARAQRLQTLSAELQAQLSQFKT